MTQFTLVGVSSEAALTSSVQFSLINLIVSFWSFVFFGTIPETVLNAAWSFTEFNGYRISPDFIGC